MSYFTPTSFWPLTYINALPSQCALDWRIPLMYCIVWLYWETVHILWYVAEGFALTFQYKEMGETYPLLYWGLRCSILRFEMRIVGSLKESLITKTTHETTQIDKLKELNQQILQTDINVFKTLFSFLNVPSSRSGNISSSPPWIRLLECCSNLLRAQWMIYIWVL